MKAFIIAAVALLSVASASHHGKPEMHWVDFNGTVPENALKVFRNASYTPVYIGQGYFEGVGLLPGMIQNGAEEMSAVANDQVYKITHNIKVLATTSKNPSSDFPWVSIHYDNLHNLKNLHFLTLPIGGTESRADVFIGRHSEPEFTDIGKVSPDQGLTVIDAEGKPTTYKNFEVLAMLNFDCDDDEDDESSSEHSYENSSRSAKNNNNNWPSKRTYPNYRTSRRQAGSFE